MYLFYLLLIYYKIDMRIFKVYKKIYIICLNVYFGEILIRCLKKAHRTKVLLCFPHK